MRRATLTFGNAIEPQDSSASHLEAFASPSTVPQYLYAFLDVHEPEANTSESARGAKMDDFVIAVTSAYGTGGQQGFAETVQVFCSKVHRRELSRRHEKIRGPKMSGLSHVRATTL